MSQIQLQTKTSLCTVLPERGGLVTSLKLTPATGGAPRELLWMPASFATAESSWPGGGIPLLFPFAGRVWHHGQLYHYGLGDNGYQMPLHGFAYASTWGIKSQSSSEITLTMGSNPVTRELYPFDFEVTLKIILGAHELKLDCEVSCKASLTSSDMPVAMGWHPYFALTNGGTAESISLSCDKYYPVTPTGAAGKIADASELGPGPWPVSHPLLGSLIFSDLKQPEATLNLSPKKPKVHLDFGPKDKLQHVVVWSNDRSQFYCIEPWMSLPDAVAIPSGCQWLKPGRSISTWLSIRLT